MRLAEHPDVEHITAEVETLPDGTVDTVLVVHTSLTLDPLGPGYDKAKVDDIVRAAHEHAVQYKDVLGKIRLRTVSR